ncbi:hypothetical protein HYV64_03370 [Candidatus Shapirobacteria bacterium]|nr:hypothetical protein [Candidatus Shapirobacteria bacterium]
MQTVKFEINPEKEYEYHQLFCNTRGFEGMSIFSFTPIKNKTKITKKIIDFWDDDDKELTKKIESEWKLIEKGCFKLFEDITETSWLYKTYHAYFLAFSPIIGFSNPFNLRSQEIALTTGAIINPKFLIGHELFHSHYYYVVDKMKMTARLNRTIFTEGVAALALFETKAKNLFPETDTESSISSYPEVRANWSIFLDYWRKRLSFEDFLMKIAQDSRF